MKVILRNVKPADHDWLASVLSGEGLEDFASPDLNAATLSASPGFIAQVGEDRLGAISYRVGPMSYEILMLYSGRPGLGIGRALVNAVIMDANDAQRTQVTVIARNASGAGVAFFKGLGFTVFSVRPTQAKTTRRHVKSSASTPGAAPVPLKADEIELVFSIRR
ncbi:MAG: hypothetical protein H0V44_06505 [Planctomycetes bacterium]|nr:hypothetical protein [Planctomycetota bacterium]